MSVISLRGGNDTATADNIRIGKRLLVVWVKQGGIILTNGLTYMRKMSDVQQIADIAAEFLNERDIFESGSKSLPTSDGINWSTTLTLEGDSIEEVASLIGQAIQTYPSIQNKDYGLCGHLVLMSFDEDYDLKKTDVLFDVGVKLDSIPGTQDGEISRNVTLYTKQGKNAVSIWGLPGVSQGGVPAFEIFWDNGSTVTNTDAPDGVLTAFTLGDGNDSYAVPAAPLILQVDPTAGTTAYQYFYYIRVDGVDVNPNDIASFNTTTKVLTFVTAPADGAKLEVAYLVDRAGIGVTSTPPHAWGTTLGTGSNFLFNWKNEQLA